MQFTNEIDIDVNSTIEVTFETNKYLLNKTIPYFLVNSLVTESVDHGQLGKIFLPSNILLVLKNQSFQTLK